MENVTNSTRVKAPNSAAPGKSAYDTVGLKPSGGLTDDMLGPRTAQERHKIPKTPEKHTKTTKKSTITCRDFTYIGTLNVRTIRKMHKRLELAHTFESSGVEILAIQEHRIIHEELTKTTILSNNAYLITTSAWRNEAKASTGGVGFIMTKKAYNAISKIEPVSPRILQLSFDGNPRLTVISVYSPTEGSSIEEAETFHDNLRLAIASIPAHDFLIVVGDLNAHLAKESDEDEQWYFHSTTNRNGELLRDTLQETEMEATNHRFRKKNGKMWTFLSDATHTKSQLDYVLVRKKWRNSIKDTEAYNYFDSVGSDHRLVLSKVRLSLRKTKTPPRKAIYDWENFREDGELQDQFTVEVRNRYSILREEDIGDTDVTKVYGHLAEAVADTCEALLPKRRKRAHDHLASDNRVITARTELEISKKEFGMNPSDELSCSVKLKKDALEIAYTVVEEERLLKKIREVETSADRCKSRQSWNLINEITDRKKSSSAQIQGGSAEERKTRWKDHFQSLLGQPPVGVNDDLDVQQRFSQLNISTEPFSKDELKVAKARIKENKACGEDGIPPEVIKRCDLDDIILSFCNGALEEGQAPEQWKISNIVPVPKKGDLSQTDNYRGISLTSLTAKTLNRMILNRIQPAIEGLLRDNQNGFRSSRSTTSHILTLRRILEGAKMKRLPAAMVFIDFKKAFDSIHRGILMKILLAYGIPKEIVDLIGLLYSGTKAQVITPDGMTELFDILAGVLQGDTLAPYLFIIVVDYCMSLAIAKHPEVGLTLTPARSRRIKADKISDTEFADDIALIADSIQEVQELLTEVETVAADVGLRMNETKTKYMVANMSDHDPIYAASGSRIELVENFLYLGSWLKDSETDIKVRKAKAWAACHKLKAIWSSNMRRSLKIRLFTATVESVLFYGSETWTLTKRLEKMVDGCYTRMLRMALGVSWKQHMTNAELYGSLPKASSKIAERRLRLSGHIYRHPELTAHKLLFWQPLHGATRRGRPPLTYIDNLRSDTGIKSTLEMGTLMYNRKLWSNVALESRVQYPP